MPEVIEKPDISPALEPGTILSYGIAPTLVAVALAIRSLIAPSFPDDAIFLYFLPPVLISAGIGGLGPGLLATTLSIGAALFVHNDPSDFFKSAVVNGAVFAAIAIGVSWGGELLHRSRRRANFMTRDALARE